MAKTLEKDFVSTHSLLAFTGVVASALVPSWTAQKPDPTKPYAGYPRVDGAEHMQLYEATPDKGLYDHAAMIGFHDGKMLATWKNGVVGEDEPGQRIMYAQSTDGKSWSPGKMSPGIMFPNISLPSFPVHLFAEPPLVLNDHLYAAASPTQFCLYPDQYSSILLLRRVYDDGSLGQMFWAASSVPNGYEPTSTLNNITTSSHMDAETKADIATLNNPGKLPCLLTSSGVIKCEACLDGCQLWNETSGVANERTHYVIPTTSSHPNQTDVLLYRTSHRALAFSTRTTLAGKWTTIAPTDIPDADSNINTGFLPNGQIFLLSNSNDGRDPLSIALSSDGWNFSKVYAVVSCKDLTPNPGNKNTNPCQPAYPGKSKDANAVAYPQGIVVTQWDNGTPGFYAIYSNNKEDIWITRFPLSSL